MQLITNSRSVLETYKISLLLILFCILAATVRAQTNDADSVVSLEADAAGLSLLPSDDIPTSGTFGIVASPTNDINDSTPPYPFLPPTLASDNVYVMANGIFLVDDTAGDAGASVPEVLAQVDAVSNLIVQVQATTTVQTSRAMGVRAMDESGSSDLTDTNGDSGNYGYSNYPSLSPIPIYYGCKSPM
jgi:hypothetical protein